MLRIKFLIYKMSLILTGGGLIKFPNLYGKCKFLGNLERELHQEGYIISTDIRDHYRYMDWTSL